MRSVSTWRAWLLAGGAALAVPFGCYEDDPPPPDVPIDYEHRGHLPDAARDAASADTGADTAMDRDVSIDDASDTPTADAPLDVSADRADDVAADSGPTDAGVDAIDAALPDVSSADTSVDAAALDAPDSDVFSVDAATDVAIASDTPTAD